MFTASNGTQFELSNLFGKDIDCMPARDFAAALFGSNTNVPWRNIGPASIKEIRAYLSKENNPKSSKGKAKGKRVCISVLLYITALLHTTDPTIRRHIIRNGAF